MYIVLLHWQALASLSFSFFSSQFFLFKEIFVGRVELELESTSIGLGFWREATGLIQCWHLTPSTRERDSQLFKTFIQMLSVQQAHGHV